MNWTIKNLQIRPITALITLDPNDAARQDEKQLKALAVLLGAYNRYGRKIDLNKHNDNVEKFNELIKDIASQID